MREDRTDGVGGGDADRERWNAHVGVGGACSQMRTHASTRHMSTRLATASRDGRSEVHLRTSDIASAMSMHSAARAASVASPEACNAGWVATESSSRMNERKRAWSERSPDKRPPAGAPKLPRLLRRPCAAGAAGALRQPAHVLRVQRLVPNIAQRLQICRCRDGR